MIPPASSSPLLWGDEKRRHPGGCSYERDSADEKWSVLVPRILDTRQENALGVRLGA